MAVYKRTYKGYSGPLTARWSRFMILQRYSYQRLFESKTLVVLRLVCLIFPVLCAAFIYFAHNLSVLKAFSVPVGNLIAINGKFFLFFCNFQGAMAYLLTAFVGPSLVSPDLVNNALPLYLSRPFSRAEYVLGKMSVLVVLLSMITWIPGLLLFAIQASLAGWEWTRANLWIAGAVFIGPLVWIVILSLIAMAISAWVKWRIAAGALLLGVFFVGAGFAAAINSVMRTKYGSLIDLATVIYTVWAQLFRAEAGTGLDTMDAWNALAAACAICLWLLFRKVRAFEVVR